GTCTASCQPGFADCDNNPADGCEVNIDVDVRNCGACGNTCALANAVQLCKEGACAVGGCTPGFDDCNQTAQDGCESDLAQDVSHCGNCMNACMPKNAVPICRQGGCGIASCSQGFSDCNSLVIDGCEVSIVADPKNCGACGRKCNGANSVQDCQL